MSSSLQIGVDTGGTFTDVVALKDGQLSTYKLSSTPGRFEAAVLEGYASLAGGAAADLIHSTTVATNALLERKGARTALITSAGFRDVLEIGRQNRPHLYDLFPARPPGLVPEGLRFELPERLASDGTVLTPLDLSPLPEIVRILRKEKIESVAVLFLFSFLRPDHEEAVGSALEAEGFEVSLSHRILPEFREVERGSTTLVNAYVRPVMGRYLSKVSEGLPGSLHVVQSNRGCLTPDRAAQEAVHTLLSGPAAGVVGAMTVAKAGKQDVNLITFDMGGTSTDVALIQGEPVISTQHSLGGFPVGVPMVDVHTVGAGGGSIASVDAGGALRVGPESAGADPGPACYGKGDRPTVTDAHVVLGHLRPEFFLQGRMRLYPERAREALSELGQAMGGLSAEEAAQGVLRLANLHMESAIRVISVQRGHDPKEFILVGFGGAGGLHSFSLAEALEMNRVMIPAHPGVLSALGCVAMPMSQETGQTLMWLWDDRTPERLEECLGKMRQELNQRFEQDGIGTRDLTFAVTLAMRYAGQSHELDIACLGPVADALEAFHAAHLERYGHSAPGEAVELVTVRLRAEAPAPELRLPELPERSEEEAASAPGGAVVPRAAIRKGDVLKGPMIIVEGFSTHLIPAGWTVVPDTVGNLIGIRKEGS
jgi:N-methylhydantoinase A